MDTLAPADECTHRTLRPLEVVLAPIAVPGEEDVNHCGLFYVRDTQIIYTAAYDTYFT